MTTYLEIEGKKYSLDDAFSKPSLNDLMALKLSTDLGLPSLQKGIAEIDALPGGLQSPELLERPDLMKVLRSIIWLTRRAAGEFLTLDEANDFPILNGGFNVTSDEDDQADPEAAADPTSAVTDSAPAAAKPAAPRRAGSPRSSKTSTKRS